MAMVKMTSDYYPYGYQMPGRHTNDPTYRYGYNGMEKNAEMYGEGNEYSTEFRQYDPRLGRWLSLDPLKGKYPSMSPYVAFNDNPVFFIDPLGLEGVNPEGEETYSGSECDDGRVVSGEMDPGKGAVVTGPKRGSYYNYKLGEHLIQSGYTRKSPSDIRFNKLKGAALELAMYKAGGGYPLQRKHVNTGLGYKVIPDVRGVAGVTEAITHNVKGPGLRRISFKSVYFEAKAVKTKIRLTRQIRGEIRAVSLEKSQKYPSKKAVDYGAASFIVVTWKDVKIQDRVVKYAQRRGVNLYKISATFTPYNDKINFGPLEIIYETDGAMRPIKTHFTNESVEIDDEFLKEAEEWETYGTNENGKD